MGPRSHAVLPMQEGIFVWPGWDRLWRTPFAPGRTRRACDVSIMNTPNLGTACFASKASSYCISDEIRIPERIEIGADPGLQFELAGPRGKLFFGPKKTMDGI